VPALAAITALEQCVQKGVRAAIVITAGFAEVGEHGRLLQTSFYAWPERAISESWGQRNGGLERNVTCLSSF